MKWRNISIATAAGVVLLASAPAFADPPRWAPAYGERGHQYRRDSYRHRDRDRRVVVIRERPRYVYERRVIVERRPAVVYRAAPAVYHGGPRYAPPRAPAYPVSYGEPGWGSVGGALTGALLGSRLGEGDGRIAGIAVGSVLGAYVGDRLATGR